jgi:hypothetical protein
MSRMGRRGMQRGLDHGSDFLLGNARNATWSWCILTQPRQTEGEKTFSPELDRRSGNSQCLRDVVVEDTIADLVWCDHRISRQHLTREGFDDTVGRIGIIVGRRCEAASGQN